MGDVMRYVECQQTAVDTATAAVDVSNNANLVVPVGKNFIDRMIVSSSSDGAALGSAVLGIEITGTGVARGTQRLMIGGGGAEVTNAGHYGQRAVTLGPLGIRVTPGGTYSVNIWMLGEDAGSTFAGVTLVFTNGAKGGEMVWLSQEVQLTAIDTNAQFQNWGGGAAAAMPVPNSSTIGYIITAGGADMAALGSGGAVGLFQGNGMVNVQEAPLVGCGGELTTGAGFWDNAAIHEANFDVRPNDSITIFGRMTGEDVGTVSVGIAVGFRV